MAGGVKGGPNLKEQLREVAEEGVLRVAEAVRESIGMGVGVEALSQWEGFGRFSWKHLSVQPMKVMTAYGLCRDDPGAEVLASYPDAKVDEGTAAHWEGNWTREWGVGSRGIDLPPNTEFEDAVILRQQGGAMNGPAPTRCHAVTQCR